VAGCDEDAQQRFDPFMDLRTGREKREPSLPFSSPSTYTAAAEPAHGARSTYVTRATYERVARGSTQARPFDIDETI
jgi:hypothetical protein